MVGLLAESASFLQSVYPDTHISAHYTANGLRIVVRVRVFLFSPLLSRISRMLGIEKKKKYPVRVTDYQFLYVINLRISNLLVPIKIIYTLALFH